MSRPEDEEADIESSRAPLLEHLTELRGRLLVCVAAFILGFILCFTFAGPLYVFLVKPFAAASALYEASGGEGVSPFELILATAGITPLPEGGSAVGLISTAPLEFLIVAPGLYRNERKAFLPFLLAAPFLFLIGTAMVYFIMLPFVMWFSLSQQIATAEVSVALMTRVSDYLNLVTALLLAFGLCFQLPVVMTLLGLAGIVNADMLASGRKYAVVAIFVVAAFVTPPDPISQVMLGLPLLILYEISIWCVRLIETRRRREDEAAA